MNIKKITAAALTVVMAAAAFSGCGKTFEKVVTVDGVDIAPNTYLFAQYQAYMEADNLVEDNKVNLLDTFIEDMPSKEWMHKETIDNLKLYVWTDKTFEQMGLELTQEEMEYIDSQVEYYWTFAEKSYVQNGIGKNTYKDNVVNSFKLEKIFAKIYGAGGEKEPSQQEFKEYMDTQYARIKGFELTKLDSEGKQASAEQLAKIVAYCEQAVEELNNGADFEQTQVKYMTLTGELFEDETDYSETPSKYTVNRFLNKSSVADGEEVLTANAFVAQKGGEYAYDETKKAFVVYQRIENLEAESELDFYKANLLSGMRGEEFNEYTETESGKLEVSEDASAVKYYSLNKIK